MTVNRVSRVGVLTVAGLVLLSGCRPVGGVAEVVNESGRDDLRLVFVDAKERDRVSKPIDEVATLDTQFFDRDIQCYVASDGRFEVRDPSGAVFARNDFADREVCDRDIFVLGPDGSLTWQEDD
jgi:hypothetical protein